MSSLPILVRVASFILVGAAAGFVAAMEGAKTWGGGEVPWELMIVGGPLGVFTGSSIALKLWGVINAVVRVRRPTSRVAPVVAVLVTTALCAWIGHDLGPDESQIALQVFLALLGLIGSTIEVRSIRVDRLRAASFRAPPQ